ncbi:MAG: methyltransferase domain-containing protein [Actinomycetota bacterium]|nr:methyltransferase domain-containing protein [Actinomycetota bacterium]
MYPAAVFDDIVSLGRVPDTGRVLEIGCGTGHATLSLAERGLEVVGLELGPQLAALARRKLVAFPNASIVNESFESWEPDGDFDAVVSFTAFHWFDPEVRFVKSAAVLRPGGALALVQPHTVLNDDRFWIESQEDYDAVVPSPDNRPPKRADEVEDLSAEIDASGVFRNVAARRHLWETHYTADEYAALISTYSPNLDLDQPTRARLLDRIHNRVERQGSVKMRYLFTLNVATTLV